MVRYGHTTVLEAQGLDQGKSPGQHEYAGAGAEHAGRGDDNRDFETESRPHLRKTWI